jgi:hypothetical protein
MPSGDVATAYAHSQGDRWQGSGLRIIGHQWYYLTHDYPQAITLKKIVKAQRPRYLSLSSRHGVPQERRQRTGATASQHALGGITGHRRSLRSRCHDAHVTVLTCVLCLCGHSMGTRPYH